MKKILLLAVLVLALVPISRAADNYVEVDTYKIGTTQNAVFRATESAGILMPHIIIGSALPAGTAVIGHVIIDNFPGTVNIGNTVTVKPTGAANTANGQVTASTTAATLKAANATRRSISIVNTDTAITVYVGIATVTTGNGFPLKAGQSISIDNIGLIQVIAASGSPVVAYLETYD